MVAHLTTQNNLGSAESSGTGVMRKTKAPSICYLSQSQSWLLPPMVSESLEPRSSAIGWTCVWGRVRKKMSSARLPKAFVEFMDTFRFTLCLRGSSAHVTAREKTLHFGSHLGQMVGGSCRICPVSAGYRAPLCFLGVEEKGPRILQRLPSRSWYYENIVHLLCRTLPSVKFITKPNWFHFPNPSSSHGIFPSYYKPLKDRDGVSLYTQGLMHSIMHIIPNPQGSRNDARPNLGIEEALGVCRFQQQGVPPNCFQKTYKREGGRWVWSLPTSKNPTWLINLQMPKSPQMVGGRKWSGEGRKSTDRRSFRLLKETRKRRVQGCIKCGKCKLWAVSKGFRSSRVGPHRRLWGTWKATVRLAEGDARAVQSDLAAEVNLVLNLNTVPALCVTLSKALFNPQFHISKIGTIISTSEGCGKDQIGHKWKRPVVSGA